MSISFKKFVQFVDLEGDVTDEQINEIFGLFQNNKKIEAARAMRDKLKDPAKKAALDKALKDFENGKKPLPKGSVRNDDLDAILSADDRKNLARNDRFAEGINEEARVKAFKVKVNLDKFPGMKKSKIENAIFGEDEGDDSWVQNQTVLTIETVSLKDDVLYVYPLYDDTGCSVKALQSSYDRWQRNFIDPAFAEKHIKKK